MAVIFLLSHQRSGSHFLKYSLNSHNEYSAKIGTTTAEYLALPEVFTPGIAQQEPSWQEWLFEPFLETQFALHGAAGANPPGVQRAVSLFFDELEHRAAGRIVLVDIKLNQLHLGEGWYSEPTGCPHMLHEISRRGKVVFLQRRNLLRAVVSGIRATQQGLWHVTDPLSHRPAETAIQLNAEECFLWVAQLAQGISAVSTWLANCGATVLQVSYEELYDAKSLTCNQAQFDRIASFAGLNIGAPWRTTMQKIGLQPLATIVANYDELVAKFANTQYSDMLSDAASPSGGRSFALVA